MPILPNDTSQAQEQADVTGAEFIMCPGSGRLWICCHSPALRQAITPFTHTKLHLHLSRHASLGGTLSLFRVPFSEVEVNPTLEKNVLMGAPKGPTDISMSITNISNSSRSP